MTPEEIKEVITEYITSEDYTLINETTEREYQDSYYIQGFEKLISKTQNLTILIDLTKYFTEDEQKEIAKVTEIEIDGDYYYIQYKAVFAQNKKVA